VFFLEKGYIRPTVIEMGIALRLKRHCIVVMDISCVGYADAVGYEVDEY